MKKKWIITVVVALSVVGSLYANEPALVTKTEQKNASVELRGVVMDKNTAENLAGAVITANGQKVYTDFDGNFVIQNVCEGKCTLKINMISYKEQTLVIDTNDNKLVQIKLNQQ